MTNPIKVTNNELQKAITSFTDTIQENLNFDINKQILSPQQNDQLQELANETFDDYEVYDENCFDLAKVLYNDGYNVFAKAIEYQSDTPLIVNEVLKEYVLDIIAEHQKQLVQERDKKQHKDKKDMTLEL